MVPQRSSAGIGARSARTVKAAVEAAARRRNSNRRLKPPLPWRPAAVSPGVGGVPEAAAEPL